MSYTKAEQLSNELKQSVESFNQSLGVGEANQRLASDTADAVRGVTMFASALATCADEALEAVREASHYRDSKEFLNEQLKALIEALNQKNTDNALIHIINLEKALTSLDNSFDFDLILSTIDTLKTADTSEFVLKPLIENIHNLIDTISNIVDKTALTFGSNEKAFSVVEGVNVLSRSLRGVANDIIKTPAKVFKKVDDLQSNLNGLSVELLKWKGFVNSSELQSVKKEFEEFIKKFEEFQESDIEENINALESLIIRTEEIFKSAIPYFKEKIIALHLLEEFKKILQQSDIEDDQLETEDDQLELEDDQSDIEDDQLELEDDQSDIEDDQSETDNLLNNLKEQLFKIQDSLENTALALTAKAQDYAQQAALMAQRTSSAHNALCALIEKHKTEQKLPPPIIDNSTPPDRINMLTTLFEQVRQVLQVYSASLVGSSVSQVAIAVIKIRELLTECTRTTTFILKRFDNARQQSEKNKAKDNTTIISETLKDQPEYMLSEWIDILGNIRILHQYMKDIRPLLDTLISNKTEIVPSYVNEYYALNSETCIFLMIELIDRIETMIAGIYHQSYINSIYAGYSKNSMRIITLKYGDTLEKLAKNYLGNADLAGALAVYNDVSSLDNFKPGDTFKIPTNNTFTRNIKNEVYDFSDDYDVLGRDIALDNTMHVLAQGDVKIVQGQKNLEQAIILRLREQMAKRTRLTLYGLNNTIGDPIISSNYIHASINITLLQEPRLAHINKLAFKGKGDALYVTIDYTDIRGSEVKTETQL